MKQKFFNLLVALGCATSMFAYDAYIEGIYYNLDKTALTAEVTNETSRYDARSYSGVIVVPPTIIYNFQTYSVTTIGMQAFQGCSGLTSVTIPNSVTTIGGWAFYGCSSLTSVTIPNSVTTLGDYAFYKCSGLTSVEISNSVTTLGDYAFYKCSGLTLITIPNSVTTIEEKTFRDCSSLTSVTIGNSVTTIGDCAFSGCSGLTSVTIPNSVTTIGDNAFYDCRGLTSVTIPNSVITIGSEAFYGCSGLTSVTIPNSVTTLGDYAFVYCSSLTKTNYTGTIAEWCKIKFGNENSNPMYCSHNLYINDVEVKEDLVIPDGVDTIGDNAFYSCTSLTSVTIPASVTTIGNYAFWKCSSLASITCHAVIPPTCIPRCFYFDEPLSPLYVIGRQSRNKVGLYDVNISIPLYVPIQSIDAYKQANVWKDFTNINSIEQVLVLVNNSAYGSVQGGGHQKSENVTLTASPKYGYHFTQWSDGNTDNPRSFVLTQDTTFTAEFAKNIYSFDVQTADSVMGSVTGAGNYEHQTPFDISATANYGYHFVRWSDGNRENPRTITIRQNLTLTAYFAPNTYSVQTTQSEYGTIYGEGTYHYLDTCTLRPNPNYGYHFTQWSDSNTDNPRSFVLTQDTTFTAEFAMNYSGQCGSNLYWSYSNGTLTITGTGAMYNEVPWIFFKDSIQRVNLPAQLTTICAKAFADVVGLKNIVIPASVTHIGASAFAGCRKLYDVHCYAIEPPVADASSFENYNVYLHVPCDNLRDYQMDAVFGSFKYVECIGAENTPISNEQVVTEPTEDNVTLIWPTNTDASTYTIEISSKGVLICTLVFNADGQLMSINFAAPARGGEHGSRYATATATGWTYTITGLEAGTDYTYTIVTKDKDGNVIDTETGSFKTKEIITSVENVDNQTSTDANIKGQKVIRNGVLYIERNGKTYNALGGEVR